MNCKEFKEKYKNKTLLAFVVVEETTHIIKLKTEFITYFMRYFLDEHFLLWRIVFFYEVFINESPDFDEEIEDIGKLIRDRAEYMYLMAKKEEQPATQCYFKDTTYRPNTKHLEGKKHRLKELRMKK